MPELTRVGPAGAGRGQRDGGGGLMTMADRAGEVPVSVWLRREREARAWSKRETARRLVRAVRDAEGAAPHLQDMCRYVCWWERGENGPSERYRMYYCEVFGLPADGFGVAGPGGGPVAAVSAPGLSVSVHYLPGRLVIEISGLEAAGPGAVPEREEVPERGLELVAPAVLPVSYGGRA